MEVFVVIVIFAVVQSLFGVGLLVFGTPTLLLLGYQFNETLGILLPASIVISLLQLRNVPLPDRFSLGQFAVWCLLPLVVTLVLVLQFGAMANLNLVVATALAGFAVVRMSVRVRERVEAWVAKHMRGWLVFTGFLHGLSNLGGGLLVILAACRHRDKENIRQFVAFGYVSFATIQLIILALLSPEVFGWHQLGSASISALVFLLVGQRLFRWVNASVFEHLLTIMVGLYAVILFFRGIGII